MKKKSYNPFKMWGSYVGAIIMWMGGSTLLGMGYYNFFYLTMWQQWFNFPAWDYSFILLSIITGFLVGWGIYSLFRRFKK